jgi:hypothetical protein
VIAGIRSHQPAQDGSFSRFTIAGFHVGAPWSRRVLKGQTAEEPPRGACGTGSRRPGSLPRTSTRSSALDAVSGSTRSPSSAPTRRCLSAWSVRHAPKLAEPLLCGATLLQTRATLRGAELARNQRLAPLWRAGLDRRRTPSNWRSGIRIIVPPRRRHVHTLRARPSRIVTIR